MTFAELKKRVAALGQLASPQQEEELTRLRARCKLSSERWWFLACRHWLFDTPALKEPLPAPWFDVLFPPGHADMADLHWQIVRAARTSPLSRRMPPPNVLEDLAKAAKQPLAYVRELAYELCEPGPGAAVSRSGGGSWTLEVRPAVRSVSLIMLLVKRGKSLENEFPGMLMRLTLELIEHGRGELGLATPLLSCKLGLSFQQSFENAKGWAERTRLWKTDHDVRLRLAWLTGDAPLPLVLDGDSAGLAFGIALGVLLAEPGSERAALAPELEFLAATGALEPDGTVKPVGAVNIHAKLGALFDERVKLGHLRWLVHWDGEEGVPPSWKASTSVPRAFGVTQLEQALKELTDEFGPKQRVRAATLERAGKLKFLGGDAELGSDAFQSILLAVPPPRVQPGQAREEKPPEPLPFDQVFARFGELMKAAGRPELTVPQLVVTAQPGDGKSVLLQHAAWSAAQRLAPFDRHLPVRFELRQWREWWVRHQGTLADYLAGSTPSYAPGVSTEHWQRWLARGELLLLLDGLEAISDHEFLTALQLQVAQWIARGNALVLVCRTRDYESHDGFRQLPVFPLLPFTEAQHDLFIGNYPGLSAARQAQLRQTLKENKEVAALAERPATLDLTCFLQASGETLPTDRRALWHKAVTVLMEKRRRETAAPRWPVDAARATEPAPYEPSLTTRRQVLARTLFNLFARCGKGEFNAAQFRRALEAAVVAVHRSEDRLPQWADAYEQEFTQRTRLINVHEGRVLDDRFREFLAGEGLAQTRGDFAAEAAGGLDEDEHKNPVAHWQETLLHACWHRAVLLEEAKDVLALVAKLAGTTMPDSDQGWRRVILSGEVLLDLKDKLELELPKRKGVFQQIQGQLVRLVEQESLPENRRMRVGLSVPERARGGVVLGWLGDPRSGVGLRSDGLPHIQFSEVVLPSGNFTLGESGKTVRIAEPYQIAIHPVTVAQYEAFVATGGYHEPAYWAEAIAANRWRLNGDGQGEVLDSDDKTWRSQPSDHGDKFRVPNAPVVGTSWYEAVAFCRWLSERTGRSIRLPHEAEYEQAARWSRTSRAADARRYPWGGPAEVSKEEPGLRCNWRHSGIESTSAVGLFRAGASESGAFDLSGNVVQWCENRYRSDQQYRAVRGGSWIIGDAVKLSSSFRYGHYPDSDYDGLGFRCVVVVVAAR